MVTQTGSSYGAFCFMFYQVRCLVVAFRGFCLAFWLSHWGRESWLLCFSLICDMCAVCHSLFALPLGVIGRLWSAIVTISVHLMYYFKERKFYAFIYLQIIQNRTNII